MEEAAFPQQPTTPPPLPTDGGDVEDEPRDKNVVREAAHQAESTIIVGDDTSEERPESVYGSDSDNDSFASASSSSSVRDFAFENGGRYHRFCEGKYLFLNDD
ncbi:hypothetical protein AOQ84DRAFT_384652 [Glonium stellatum]|uniref:Uncharacterized protein n=1 Tax=Glonium stellatum TaxID=574774 RepID=A0A8E2FCX2_9PEZI|nr:hypothetical protein AOQ84DRAFT_384652 [Glonium stellatum]